ncbi:MAG TPA: hypothetical protein VGC37_19780, partial [Friedmanniella sp.]
MGADQVGPGRAARAVRAPLVPLERDLFQPGTGDGARMLDDPWRNEALLANEAAWHDGAPDGPEPGQDGEPEWVARLGDPAWAAAVDCADPDHDRDWYQDSARVSGAVEHLAPGPALARVLAEVDPRVVDDATVADLAAAAVRMGAWTHALLTRLAGELATRTSMNPTWPDRAGTIARPGIAADELAMRLAVSSRAAQALVNQGVAFDQVLAATGHAVAEGRVDATRARILV